MFNSLRAVGFWRVCGRLLTSLGVACAVLAPSGNTVGQIPDISLQPGWLPTELAADRQYVGKAVCLSCHPAQSKYSTSAMAGALRSGSAEGVLTERTDMKFERPPLIYRIERRGDQSIYTVTNGVETMSTPIVWAFGRGEVGQTFLISVEGRFQEARVSYFKALDGLDWTLGTPSDFAPRSVSEAAGRSLSDEEVRRCFGCHATGAVRDSKMTLPHMEPGISCEGCHGPGDKHLEAISSGADDVSMGRMLDMAAEQQADFCGSCHRTWAEVAAQKIRGVDNVRFQPFRLVNSKCYDPEDARIRCAACHDPHEDPRRDVGFYDDKCLACHAGGTSTTQASAKAPACTVAKQDCSSCHMPKVEIPGAHFAFSDHAIRIARPGDPYPN